MIDNPESNSPDVLTEKDKIDILLEEYKTLRADILLKITIINQVYTVSRTAFIGIVGLSVNYHLFLAGISMTVVLLILVTVGHRLMDHDIRLISSRIREIESDVNRRSGDVLLKWESVGSLAALGRKTRFKRIIAPLVEIACNFLRRLRAR